ncbi:hypothetical protein L9F63_009391, partial [Diploptera punctata]
EQENLICTGKKTIHFTTIHIIVLIKRRPVKIIKDVARCNVFEEPDKTPFLTIDYAPSLIYE